MFLSVGWSEEPIEQVRLDNFNIGFINSTSVFSAWDNGKLIACVRTLSDMMFRSIILDLAVSPEYQNKGIGKELVQRCRDTCPDSEWLVGTDKAVEFYKKIGFTLKEGLFLTIPSKWF